MLTAEAYQKMSIAKAITMVELDRIDAHTSARGAFDRLYCGGLKLQIA